VRLELAVDPHGDLLIKLEDDGLGFAPRPGKAGRGLANIRSRASLIDARIAWSSRTDGGTVFSLRRASAFVVQPSSENDT
jgi:signal transduction histidine kinase